MEAGLRSRKRKQHSSNSDPFDGIFTRSKSQIYLHRHRSGYARPDSVRNRNLIQSLEGTTKSLVKDPSEATIDQIGVKDLRARRVFSPTAMTDEVVNVGEADSAADLDVHKKNDGNTNGLCSEGDVVRSDLGVSDSVANDLKPTTKYNVKHTLVRENNIVDADESVQMTPSVPESDQNKKVVEKNGMVSVANEVVDTKGSVNKNQATVTSLRGRRKVFKSPSSFSYRRLLPYLKELGKDDSSSFEIVEATLLEKLQKSSNMTPHLVACKDEEMGAVSDCDKLADCTFDNTKSCEKQYSNSVTPDLIGTVESSGVPEVVEKNHEDVLNDTTEECEQMTPPDSDIYSTPNVAKSPGVLVNPTDAGNVTDSGNERIDYISSTKLVLKPCSRMKILQIPTSFSHRRLLPFLMSVSGDDSRASKVDQTLKLEKAMEQNQQPTLSFLGQNISVDESKTTNNSGQPSAAVEKSDSPTSTLIPADTSVDRIKAVSLVASEKVLDINAPDTECGRSTSQVEDKLQAEAVNFDSSVKSEQTSPNNNLKRVEEATSKAISSHAITSLENLRSICTKQSTGTNDECMRSRNGYSEDKQMPVNKSIDQSSLQIEPLNSSGIYGENFRNGILKRTPRGCRGICNCLNCTSFRLHAERSFEFSRNQMHDAEDVVLELINDLTCLRKILERSASDSNYLETVKEKQVCAKALYKEEAARARLAQMKEDLSIHCRSMKLLRPKVTFANKIEEKLISEEVYVKKSV